MNKGAGFIKHSRTLDTWTSVGQDHLHHMASLGHSELKLVSNPRKYIEMQRLTSSLF